jgi:hypothetical protein
MVAFARLSSLDTRISTRTFPFLQPDPVVTFERVPSAGSNYGRQALSSCGRRASFFVQNGDPIERTSERSGHECACSVHITIVAYLWEATFFFAADVAEVSSAITSTSLRVLGLLARIRLAAALSARIQAPA